MNHAIFTAVFWKDTLERIVSTVAQAEVTVLGLSGATEVVKFSIETALLTAAFSAAACLLKCLAATGVSDPSTASMVNTTPDLQPVIDRAYTAGKQKKAKPLAGQAGMAATELCIIVVAVVLVLWAVGVVPR